MSVWPLILVLVVLSIVAVVVRVRQSRRIRKLGRPSFGTRRRRDRDFTSPLWSVRGPHGRPSGAAKSGPSEDSQTRTTRVAEGVGLPTAGARRERVLPIQVSARKRTEAEEQQRAGQTCHDRVSHPQPDGRARQAGVLRRGVVNKGAGRRPDSRGVESCNNALVSYSSLLHPTFKPLSYSKPATGGSDCVFTDSGAPLHELAGRGSCKSVTTAGLAREGESTDVVSEIRG